MKTSKFVLVITFVAFATMIFAQAERPKNNEPAPTANTILVKISLEKALMNRGLVKAMYQQLDPQFLQNEVPGLYTATVRYRKVTYAIFGTLKAWRHFFIMDINDDPDL